MASYGYMRWAFSVVSLGSFAVLLSAQVDLPDDKGKDVVERMCVKCHSATQFSGRKYTKSRWADVVDDMVSRGAEGSDDEVKTVLSYLTRNFGRQVNVNTSNAQQLKDGLSLTLDVAEQVVRYRADHGNFKSAEDLAKVPGIDAAFLDEQKKNLAF